MFGRTLLPKLISKTPAIAGLLFRTLAVSKKQASKSWLTAASFKCASADLPAQLD